MKRQQYIQPECTLVPLHASDNLMGIDTSVHADTPFGKQTDFEEQDDWNDDVEITFGHTVKTHDVWDDFSDYKSNKKKRR